MPSVPLNRLSACRAAAVAVFVVLGLTYLLRPISDPDFFWHLKTGEWIWQNGKLPDFDPFAFTGPQVPSEQQLHTLQGYPLAQLLYFGLMELFGWGGIFALRFALAAAFIALLWSRFAAGAREAGFWWLRAALTLLFFVMLLEVFTLDRPQVFSFLGFGLLLLIYDRIKRAEAPSVSPLMMLATFALLLLWGWAHPGYIIGVAVLLCLLLVELLAFAVWREGRKNLVALGWVVASGVLGALWHLRSVKLTWLLGLLGTDVPKQSLYYTSEYLSLWQYYAFNGDLITVVHAVFIIAALILSLRFFSKNRLAETILLFAVGAYSFLHLRYLPFFLIAAVPVVAGSLMAVNPGLRLKKALLVGLLVPCSWFAWDEFGNAQNLHEYGAVSRLFPVAAVDYLQSVDRQGAARGEIFNPYEWGGYLLWRLSPTWRVYQDGRDLNPKAMLDWLSCLIDMQGPSGQPLWKDVFTKYAVRMAILPKFSRRGVDMPHELSYKLSQDPAWRVLYHDDLAIIFIRNPGA